MNFVSISGPLEYRQMHSKSDNSEIMSGFEKYKIIEQLFELLLWRYQVGLEQSMRSSNFVFDGVDGLHYKYHKVSPNDGRYYKDSYIILT